MKPESLDGYTIPNTPMPPDTGSMDPLFNALFLGANWVIVVVFLLLALRHFRQTGSRVQFYCLIGGGLCVLIEPIVDILGLCWFWEDGNWVLAELIGRFIPAWLLPVYIWFVGGQCFYVLQRMEKGITTRDIWKLYLVFALANIVLEEIPLHLGLYTYYGAQPLQLSLLPLWWPIVNAAMPIVAATVIFQTRSMFGRWHGLAIIPLLPMSDALTNAATAWPLWVALNSTDSLLTTHIAAATTLGLALLLIHITSSTNTTRKIASETWGL